ncbi:MAG: hypothetical protein MRY83_03525, partial [Flavobacteriales bacterium]|nr:hypothetical protein [Flavobacteriales bacterium]
MSKTEKQHLPVCSHPTTVALIDDDPSFINATKLNLGSEVSCMLFSNPNEALHFINDVYKPHSFIEKCIFHRDESDTGRRNIEIDVESIYKHVYDPNRFNEISVIVADQVMPDLLGLDLCKQVTAKNINKILLTGKANDNDVISAFNNEIINKYIEKSSQDLEQRVSLSINDMQQKYFEDLSDIIIENLTRSTKAPSLEYLEDPVFINFFKKLLKQKNIVEYYLLDADGSFLLIDFDGKPSWFLVRDEQKLMEDVRVAEAAEPQPSGATLDAMRNYEKILFRLSA